MPLDPSRLEFFATWHQEDPPDEWEKQRSAAIAKVQGNPNPFVGQAPTTPEPQQVEPAEDQDGRRLESMLKSD
jgi:endonuclease I